MKLVIINIVLSVLFFNQQLPAQRIELSKPEKKFKTTFTKIVGENNNGFLVLSSESPISSNSKNLNLSNNKTSLSFRDNLMSKIWEIYVDLPTFDAQIVHVSILDSRAYLYYKVFNKGQSAYDLNVFAYSLTDGKHFIKETPALSIPVEKRRDELSFAVCLDPNGKGYAVSAIHETIKSEYCEIYFQFLDEELNQKWLKTFPKTLLNESLKILDLKVDTNQTVVVLMTNSERIKINNNEVLHFIYSCNSESGALKAPYVFSPEYYLQDVEMTFKQDENSVAVCGFYTERREFSNSGVFLLRLDASTDSVFNSSYQNFKVKTLGNFDNESVVGDPGKTLINYEIQEVIMKSDGGMVLIAEANFITESSTFNVYSQVYSTSFTYHYNNVLIFSISKNGDIEWDNVLRKRQVSENDGAVFSSYSLFVEGSDLYFIFNKAIKRRTDVIVFSIDASGKSSEKILLNEREETILQPKGSRQISSNELVIPCIVENKDSYLRLIF
ncbi:MAG: hypothetical protein ACJAZ3_000436 [Sphingobacteriales bacterium]|jgi:hypothetical protein